MPREWHRGRYRLQQSPDLLPSCPAAPTRPWRASRIYSSYALFDLPDVEGDLSSVTSQGDDNLQLVSPTEGRKHQVVVKQTPLFVDLLAQVGITLDQLTAADALDREWFSLVRPAAMNSCGALGEEQYRLEDHLPAFHVNV